jgi:hypothetical protein
MKNQKHPWSIVISFFLTLGSKTFSFIKNRKDSCTLNNLLMTYKQGEKTNKPPVLRLIFFPLKDKRIISL